MENILEINNYEQEYDYSNIKLSNPTIQAGNNYYTNITYGERDKPLYIQFPKCITKAGYVKNNTKSYTDLIFSASDHKIIKWLENFENYLQNEIYKKRDLWFDSDFTLDDIQELMTPVIRSYRSGKNILVRCNIKNHKCSIYDEDEVLLDLDKFTSDKDIIPLICVNGIKFSSKNFTIELNLTQVMILSNKDDLEKNCLIKSNNLKNNSIKNSKVTSIPEEYFDNNKEPLENFSEDGNSKNVNLLDLERDTITLDNKNNHDKTIINSDISENIIENNELSIDILEKNIVSEDSNILLDIDNKKNEEIEISEATEEEQNKELTLESKKENSSDMIEVLDEVDLDTININKNSKDEENNINIRDAEEIYYEIYKNALIKANNLKKNTIEAFLNAKNIKIKYNLEDLDLNLEELLDEECKDLSELNL